MELRNADIEPPGLLSAGEWNTLAEAHENALVVLAMGMDCSVHPTGGGYALMTDAAETEQAMREIELYAGEQTHVPPVMAPHWAEHPFGIVWMLIWATVLAWIFSLQNNDPTFTDRFSNSSYGLMSAGEWWRPFTALFLHADPPHLLGNVLIGGMFCLLVSRSIGAALGWLLILLGGTLGNAINAALHFPQPFSSIGASTATFTALGILVGLGASETIRLRSGKIFRSLSLPILAGLILFSWFGVSGDNTDIAGHAWGGMCGVTLGFATGSMRTAEP